MRLTARAVAATVLVGLAEVIYLLWYDGTSLPGFGSPRAVAGAFLVLAWAACAGAAAQDPEGVTHAPALYLATASVLGVVALVTAITVLVTGSTLMLAVLAIVTGVLWAMATVRGALADAKPTAPPAPPTQAATHERTGAGR